MARKLILRTGQGVNVISAKGSEPIVAIEPPMPVVPSALKSLDWLPLNSVLGKGADIPPGCMTAYRLVSKRQYQGGMDETDPVWAWTIAGNYDLFFRSREFSSPPDVPLLNMSRANHVITAATRGIRKCRFGSEPYFIPEYNVLYVGWPYR